MNLRGNNQKIRYIEFIVDDLQHRLPVWKYYTIEAIPMIYNKLLSLIVVFVYHKD